jgi:hypothetical protein
VGDLESGGEKFRLVSLCIQLCGFQLKGTFIQIKADVAPEDMYVTFPFIKGYVADGAALSSSTATCH